MGKRNCPNCGAAITFEDNKCPYCGTSYYDLSCMPMDRPFFMRIDTSPFGKGSILAKVLLQNATFRTELNALPEINIELVCLSAAQN